MCILMHVCVVFADRSHSYVGTTCLDIFSYYRLFVDDLIDTLGLKLYILVCTWYMYAYNMYVHVQLHMNPRGEMGRFGEKKQKTRKSTVS